MYRSTAPIKSIHGVYKPRLCFIAQGRKQVMLGEEIYVYDPARCLWVAVDLPVINQVQNATLSDTVLRLLRLLDTPQHIPALAPLVQRKILYRLLAGVPPVTTRVSSLL